MSLPPPPPLAVRLEAARRLGCEATSLDPDSGFLWSIHRGHSECLLLGGLSPLNTTLTARLAQDKSHTLLLARRAGFRTPESVRCLRPGTFTDARYPALIGTEPGLRFAETHGWPVVVKPNAGARGRDIALVHDADALTQAIEQIWQRDYLALVQTPAPGVDLRIDILDDKLLFAYRRRPVILHGNGTSTVRELLASADRRFADHERLMELTDDPLWIASGIALDQVLSTDREVDLSGVILNLNRLCIGERLLEVPARWIEHTKRVATVLGPGLRHYGIDWRIDSDDPEHADPERAVLLEINASPSLAHMATTEHREDAIAAEMRVVEALLDAQRG
ncbi:MAG: hypothetical protein AAGD38_00490 [Acidobacteriota bacterium]